MDAKCSHCGKFLERDEAPCCLVARRAEHERLLKRDERCERLEGALKRAKRTLEYYAAPVKMNGREIGNLSYRAKAGLRLIDAALKEQEG